MSDPYRFIIDNTDNIVLNRKKIESENKMFNKQAMKELKEMLETDFPNDIDKVIVFGSRVRGNAHTDSDYDILLIVKKKYDWKFEDKIRDSAWEIGFRHDIFTDIKIISTDDLQSLRGKQPFILDALENGVRL